MHSKNSSLLPPNAQAESHSPTHTDNPVVVDTPEALTALVSQLGDQPIVAVDTEANSLYAYHEQVCLIQISIPGTDYLVDPLALQDLSPLAPFFESTTVEKIFHAADYDLMVLLRDFGFTTRTIFDTMWAARVLGWERVGLADILREQFDVSVNKRYQRYNWGRRPIDAKALRYAWMDSHYLLPLREIQTRELVAMGRWDEAQEIFEYLTETVEVPTEDAKDQRYWRIKGVHRLDPDDQRILYTLYRWRERTASSLDRPPVKVLSNRKLYQLARARPRNREELISAGLAPSQVRRFGDGVLDALRTNHHPRPPARTQSARPPDDVLARFKTLKAWRKDVAAARGVDSDVILPNAVLWEIAERPPARVETLQELPGIGPWRQAAYGPDLIALVSH
jgi:ribonuclease D